MQVLTKAPCPPSGPFSRVLAAAGIPRTSLVYRWFDFLAFALSGLPVDQVSGRGLHSDCILIAF